MLRPLVLRDRPERGIAPTPSVSSGFESLYPNPFSPHTASTTVRFSLPRSGSVTITIFNILGLAVRTLDVPDLSAGVHAFTWDGKNTNGALVPAGEYILTLQSGDYHAIAKMLVTE